MPLVDDLIVDFVQHVHPTRWITANFQSVVFVIDGEQNAPIDTGEYLDYQLRINTRHESGAAAATWQYQYD